MYHSEILIDFSTLVAQAPVDVKNISFYNNIISSTIIIKLVIIIVEEIFLKKYF